VKNKRIYYNVYPFGLRVFFDTPYKKIRKKLRKTLPKKAHSEIKDLRGTYAARTMMFSTGQTVIVFRSFDNGIVAHEALHAVQFLFDRIRIHDYEAQAYMLQYIVSEIHRVKNGVI